MSGDVMEVLHPREYIKAGAGAGKTFKITQKVGNLVKQETIQPEKILAVTFTNAAASEMRERIRTKLIESGLRAQAEKVKEATISTIHGFGLELIERFAFAQGISPKPRQLTEPEEDQLIRKALAEVETIEAVLYELESFGYRGSFKGDDYVTPVDQFKSRILAVIKKLRSLGKGNPDEAKQLLVNAQNHLEFIYGQNLSKAETLNQALWDAVQTLRTHQPDGDVLYDLWGSNGSARNFVKTVYSITSEQIATDWKAWTALQTIKAPKIEKSDDVGLAEAIWTAADKLSVHPGPLQEAKGHITALLNGAIESLNLYQQAKSSAGLVDFSDMVHLANQILNSPEFIEEMVGRFDCLIIDEFQDTNPLQFALLNRFQQAGVPTLIVGDLKQSIMGFQGSDARLFAGLLQKGEQTTEIEVSELVNNWRSTPAVMKFVNAMGEQLYGDMYQELSVTEQAAYQSELPAVQKLVFDTKNWAADRKSKNKFTMNKDANNFLADYIVKLLAQGVQITDKQTGRKRALKPSDIAVLGAKHDTLYSFSNTLNQFGLKTRLTQGGFLETEAIQWVLNGLKFVADPTHYFAALDLLTSSYANYPLKTLLDEFMHERAFTHPVVQELQAISYKARLQDFPSAIASVIEVLDVWTRLEKRADYAQQRANLLKLIHLADEFQTTQSEALEAMGIFGKNLNTFVLWLKESAASEEFNKQPQYDSNAEESVVLSTWHASKGLEWPIVLVLNLHDERTAKLPSIDVSYQSDDIDQMLDSSYVQFLFEFADSKTKTKMLQALEHDNLNTLKNLSYVVLTRARESLILPWFENGKDLSMLGLLQPLFADADFECQSTNMVYVDEPENEPPIESINKVLDIQPCNLEKRSAVISPSAIHLNEATQVAIQSDVYGAEVNFKALEQHLEANEIGTWVHKLFEVGIQNSTLLELCTNLLPEQARDQVTINAVQRQVEKFVKWLEKLNPIQLASEVPVLAQNENGQTISGMIDLLVETELGYWIIDHKTDRKADVNKHLAQLQIYASVLPSDKSVKGLAINWVRIGQVDQMEIG
jgi:ATP-dependent exoDNAse (exonuclease V) beta subunit